MVTTIINDKIGHFDITLDEEGVIKLRQILKAVKSDSAIVLFNDVINGGINLLYDFWCGDNNDEAIKNKRAV
jgi:hypothetical protein